MDKKVECKRPQIPEVYRTAVLAALAAGILAHLFGLVNPLHNYDDISAQPYGYGTGITSGRWFLTVLGELAYTLGLTYNLPLVNGLVFLLLLAVSAAFLVSALKIRRKTSALLVSMLFVVFPAATSSLYFKFTSPYYGVAILLAVLAAWVMHRCKFSLLLSAVCTALSLGIYQAYTPMTIAFFVLMLLRYALEEDISWKDLIRRGISYCLSLVLGLLLYVVCLKGMLLLMDTHLSEYQSINRMGIASLADLPYLVKTAFSALLYLPQRNYGGIATTSFMRLLYLLMAVISLAGIAITLIQKKKKFSMVLLTALLCLVFPLAVNFIVVMCPDSFIYTLMLYGFVAVPCFPIVILECLPEDDSRSSKIKLLLRKATACILAFVIFFYAYEANVTYLSLHFANRQTENYFNSIVTQVRMTEGFTSDKEWAFIGNVSDPLLNSFWMYETRYGGNVSSPNLINGYNWMAWLYNYIGYTVPRATEEAVTALSQTEEVKAMPCWPDQGSIQVIGDTVVIKFQELTQ